MKTAKLMRILTVFVLLVGFSSASAQISIAEKEVKLNGVAKFTNYVGPVKQPYLVNDILGIGYYLASSFGTNGSSFAEGRYAIKRVICFSNNKYSADLFILGATMQANHVKTLMRIVGAYLEKQFSMKRIESDILAKYILNYNGIYRGNMEHVKSIYGPEVVLAVDPAKVGIALNYKNWPGNSEIIIPLNVSDLYGKNVGSRALYNSTLSNLRSKPDMGVDDREKMIQAQKDEVAKKEAQLAVKQQEQQREVDKTQGDISNLKKGEASAQRDIDIAKKNDELSQKTNQASKLTAEAAKLNEEKKQIAKDESLLAKDKAAANPSGQESGKYIYYLKLAGAGRDVPLKQICSIDKDQNTFSRSQDGLAGQNILLSQGNVLVIYPAKLPKYSMTILDGDTFDIVKQSSQAVYSMTQLVQDGAFIYAVIEKDGKYFLGRFDADLNMKMASTGEIYKNSDIVISKDSILVTITEGSSRKVAAFKKDDLSLIKSFGK